MLIYEMRKLTKEIDEKGWTPLHYAVYTRKQLAVKFLLDIDISSAYIADKDWKRTALHIAACRGFQYGMEEIIFNEILAWMKDLGTGPLGKIEMQNIEGSKTKENMILKFEKVKDSHLVAAALIATVTFAAMFTVPGGYVSDENNLKKGTPILSGNSAFTAFMISDTIAMVLSTSCVFIHFILVMLGYLERYYWLIRCAFSFLFYAMLAMVITFVTGAYAVLAPSIGYGICVIGLSFSYFIFYSIMRVTWSLFLSADDDEEEVNQYKTSNKNFLVADWWNFLVGFLVHCPLFEASTFFEPAEAINGRNPGPIPFDVQKEAWQTLSVGNQLGLVFSQPDDVVVNFLVKQINYDMLAFEASRSWGFLASRLFVKNLQSLSFLLDLDFSYSAYSSSSASSF
ncbi:hypothetical protein GH714_025290 [Hevea brasiliensis]|uniref:PGG domain-containing protein n=1 Tax=Hevea brasiliensis TaxID=3981 RepID=A0A6A6MZJ8_HEVBR|nr:hypothetical protein GH714_025290 [Hevea brasiliensis]